MPPETLNSLDKDALKRLVLALVEQNKGAEQGSGRAEQGAGGARGRARSPFRLAAEDADQLLAAALDGTEGQSPRGWERGRKGRPGVTRALCPDPDHSREVYAERCACGATLSPADQPHVHAYDHIDLPPIKPVTTRVKLHRGTCPCCKRRVAATPPADMPPGSPFGPGIVSLVAYLHACQMVSYNRMTEVLDGLFGLKLSEGAIANMLARAHKPFAARAARIAETVRQSPVIASDETSARVCGKTHWQWTFAAATAVFHTIAPTRGKAVPIEFLAGVKPKVWLSDRLAAQGKHAEAHQVCLAHLMRMRSTPSMPAIPSLRPPSSASCRKPAPSLGGGPPSPMPRSKPTRATCSASSTGCSTSSRRKRTATISGPAWSSTGATSCSCS